MELPLYKEDKDDEKQPVGLFRRGWNFLKTEKTRRRLHLKEYSIIEPDDDAGNGSRTYLLWEMDPKGIDMMLVVITRVVKHDEKTIKRYHKFEVRFMPLEFVSRFWGLYQYYKHEPYSFSNISTWKDVKPDIYWSKY